VIAKAKGNVKLELVSAGSLMISRVPPHLADVLVELLLQVIRRVFDAA
jgi:hypothetical protein